MRFWRIQTLFLATLAVTLAAQPAQSQVGDWPMYNHDLAGTRYSPLTQINTSNVARLTKAWSYRLRTDEERKVLRGNIGTFSETTPIAVGGLLYLTAGNRVLALDPETGKEIWRYESQDPRFPNAACPIGRAIKTHRHASS